MSGGGHMHVRWSHACQVVTCMSGGGHMHIRWRSHMSGGGHTRQVKGIAISTNVREMESPPWLVQVYRRRGLPSRITTLTSFILTAQERLPTTRGLHQ